MCQFKLNKIEIYENTVGILYNVDAAIPKCIEFQFFRKNQIFIGNSSFRISAHFIYMCVYIINTRDDRAHKNVNYPIYNNYKQNLLNDDDDEEERKKTVENFHFFWHTHTHIHNF